MGAGTASPAEDVGGVVEVVDVFLGIVGGEVGGERVAHLWEGRRGRLMESPFRR